MKLLIAISPATIGITEERTPQATTEASIVTLSFMTLLMKARSRERSVMGFPRLGECLFYYHEFAEGRSGAHTSPAHARADHEGALHVRDPRVGLSRPAIARCQSRPLPLAPALQPGSAALAAAASGGSDQALTRPSSRAHLAARPRTVAAPG